MYYFIGLIIIRIGSLAIEPALKRIRFVKFTSYTEFVKALKSDSKIDILSEINNYLRSLLTCITYTIASDKARTSALIKMVMVLGKLEMGYYNYYFYTIFICISETKQLYP